MLPTVGHRLLWTAIIIMTSSSPAAVQAATNQDAAWQSHDQAAWPPAVLLQDDSMRESYSGWAVQQQQAGAAITDDTHHHHNGTVVAEANFINDNGQFSELSFSQLLELQKEMLRNFTHSVDDPEYDLLRRPAWRGLMLALYITVILVGLIGNFIVVFVVVKNRKMQNVTNLFIANLALSDITLCVFSLPIQLYYQLTDHWIFGDTLCRMIFAAFCVPMYVSTLTILLIAIDRYWLIIYPLRDRMSMKTALILISMIVVTSFIFSIPVIWFSRLHIINHPDLQIHRHYCIEQWPVPVARKVYSAFMYLLQFIVPLCMTGILYYKIYCRLKQRPLQRQNTNQERKQKTNKILFAIVTLFIICWFPWNTFTLLVEIDHDLVRGPHFKFVDLILKVFAMSSACINPFLYCWLNDNFRKELDSMAIKMKLMRERPSPRHRQSPQYQIQPTVDLDQSNMHHHGDIIAADMCTSRLSISRMSTTRLSTGSITELPSTGTANTAVSRNSIVAQAPPGGFGNYLTVPV